MAGKTRTETAAPAMARVGHCGAVGSWSPGEGRRRVPWRCGCKVYSYSPDRTTVPWQQVCICGHTQAVHQLVEVK